jgi:hypothetical protein
LEVGIQLISNILTNGCSLAFLCFALMLNPSEREQVLKRYSAETQKSLCLENDGLRYRLWGDEMFSHTRSFMTDSTLFICVPYIPECRGTSIVLAVGPSNIQEGDTLVTVWEFRDQIPEALTTVYCTTTSEISGFALLSGKPTKTFSTLNQIRGLPSIALVGERIIS